MNVEIGAAEATDDVGHDGYLAAEVSLRGP
jgi:hypothetical protein